MANQQAAHLPKKTIIYLLTLVIFCVSMSVSQSQAHSGSQIFPTVWAWSPDGTLLAIGDNNGNISIEYSTSRQVIKVMRVDPASSIHSLSWSVDGSLLASGLSDQTAKVWDIKTGELLHTLIHDMPVAFVLWGDDTNTLYTSTTDPDYSPAIRKWDVVNETVTISQSGVFGRLAWSGDKQYIVSLTGGLTLINPDDFSVEAQFSLPDDHQQNYQSASISISEEIPSRITVGYLNGWVRIWDIENRTIVAEFEASSEHPTCCIVGSATVFGVYYNEEQLMSITQGGLYRVWDVETQTLLAEKEVAPTSFRAFFSPDGTRLAYLPFSDDTRAEIGVIIVSPFEQ